MGRGLLFAAISGAAQGHAEARDDERRAAEQEKKVMDEKALMQERARLEEEKILRIDQVTRDRNRSAAVSQAQDIDSGVRNMQNERDAKAINAQHGSSMTAADADVLRANPEARKQYGLLDATRETDLEDRASFAEMKGYMDVAKDARSMLQQGATNKRLSDNDKADNARADKQLDAQIAHWDRVARNSNDSASKRLAEMKLEEFQIEARWKSDLAKTKVGSPERADLMQKGRDLQFIKDAVNDVTVSTKTEVDGVETTTTRKMPASQSQQTQETPTAESIAKLRSNPSLRDAFNKRFGAGSADQILKTGGDAGAKRNPVAADEPKKEQKPVRSAAQIRGNLETRKQFVSRGKFKTQYKNPKTGTWHDSQAEATKGL